MGPRTYVAAFTLIEVAVATALFSTLLLMSWFLVPQTVMANQQSLLKDYARLLAAEELSEFRSVPSQDVRPGRWHDKLVRGPEECDFHVVSEISSVSGYATSALRRAEVKVIWKYRQRVYQWKEEAESCGIVF